MHIILYDAHRSLKYKVGLGKSVIIETTEDKLLGKVPMCPSNAM